ncbi:MAG: phospholipase D family protein [Polyangiaceae bacterium]|nr:phospholipase D family protein [Polyangiaceae bacterium]
MLSPDVRSLYTAALTPPQGHAIDQAIATTFSIDPTTLLTVPLHLALLHRGRGVEQDPIALLEAIRRIAARTTVYAQRGRMQVPAGTHVLYGLLEPMVIEARAPHGGVFHPKLWVLRFVEPESGAPPLLRLLVLSRNLTADRSWDLLLQLDGRPTGQYVAANRELGELIADLPTMAAGEVPEARREQAERLGDELRRTRWELPDGYESVAFHVLGRRKGPFRLPPSHELAVISPFVRDAALEMLRASTKRLVAVISRPEELDEIARTRDPRSIAEGCWTLQESAETEDGEAIEGRDTLGLHAKAYILRCGWDTKLFVGSANATSAALLAGMNIEVLAELTGKASRVKNIEDLLGPEGLGPVLMPYTPPEAPAPLDQAEQAAERALEAARGLLVDAALTARCAREADGWALSVEAAAAVLLQGIAALRSWPLTVTEDRAADASGLVTAGRAALGRFAVASITGLIAFELTAAGVQKRLRFALNLPVVGLPAERDAAILRTVVRNRDGFLRYLLLLLGDLSGMEEPAGPGAGGGEGTGAWTGAASFTSPLLEELTRAFSRDRARLREIGQVIRRLQEHADDAEAVVPPEVLELWQVFERALGEGS